MQSHENIIREFYAAAEGRGIDTKKFVSMFSDDGYMRDIPSGTDLRGQAIGRSIADFALAFPDVHRELLSIYVTENVVVVELATLGTHEGELAPTGKSIDVPSCDVFHLTDGKVASFHCYNAVSVMLQQLRVSGS
jgi:ketosteroid isomerase-like protein